MTVTPPYFSPGFSATPSVLDAVNILISSLGESPVTTITPGDSVDVDNALICLNEADLKVQMSGWEWNREYAMQMNQAADGTIPLPNNLLRLVQAYFTPQFSLGDPIKMVARGSLLYDQTNHTSIFQGPVLCDLILRLTWDQLPAAARQVIGLEALGKFQSRTQQSNIVLQFNPEELRRAWTILEQQQDDESADNAIDGNANVIQALYGLRGLRRNRQGL